MSIINIQNKLILLKIIIISLLLNIIFLIFISQNINQYQKMIYSNLKSFSNSNYEPSKFAIIRRTNCPFCGFFSFYIVHLGCINKYINIGYIPIIDVMSFPNVFNGFNISKNNYWELFFNQPFGYTLKDIIKKAKNLKYIECTGREVMPDPNYIYYNQMLLNYWHDFAQKYMSIKNKILIETYIIMKKLFNGSMNILGVKMRGTDYISSKPAFHPIPPKVEMVILDVQNLYSKYKYDWIFMTTEDEIMKEKFIKKFRNKIKLYNPKKRINYNYTLGNNIMLNKEINGNIDYAKNYLINIIILSKCIDIVSARGSGAAGIFILTKGFRYSLIYNIGDYK